MTQDLPRPNILVIIPPPIWALVFILASHFIGKALGVEPLFRQTFAGWAIFFIGFAISASGRLAFAKAGTEVVPVSKKNSHLVTDFPFNRTRNPMYLGIVTGMIGVAFISGTVLAALSAILFFLFVNSISIPYEEEKMERQFGDDFRAYKARVRRWI